MPSLFLGGGVNPALFDISVKRNEGIFTFGGNYNKQVAIN
jgi:hypothetical protein